MSLVAGKDIIIVGLQPWDTEIGSNCKNIALEFCKTNRVLYVNSPLDRISSLRRTSDPLIKKRKAILKGEFPNLESINANLWVYYPDVLIESINWIKIRAIFHVLNVRNNKLLARSILKAVNKLEFNDFLLFNDNDIFRSFYLKDYLKPKLSIYYSRDYLLGVHYWKYHGEFLEPKLISKSDICVANSVYLKEYCRRYNSSSYYIGQGCDLEIFQNIDLNHKPRDIVNIKGPVIGYVGALQSSRLDIDLIEYIALNLPSFNLILVGPEDESFMNSRLHNLDNIYFTGSKRPDELPYYINSFDVCVNPQKVNELTIGNYPRKIDEYLILGKAVVATRTESMRVFEKYVFLAETKEEYIEMINLAMQEESDLKSESRRQFAATHTWEASVREIYRAVLENCNV